MRVEEEERIRRVFIVRLWRDTAVDVLELRGEALCVGQEQTVYIRSFEELRTFIEQEMNYPTNQPPPGLR